MASVLSKGSLLVQLILNIERTVEANLEPIANLTVKDQKSFAPGLAIDELDSVFYIEDTIAASSSVTFDLAGSMIDALGQPFLPVELVLVYIVADPANTNGVIIGNLANSALIFAVATDSLVLGPGDRFLHERRAGIPVTGTSADLLKLANSSSGTGVDYKMLLAGRSA